MNFHILPEQKKELATGFEKAKEIDTSPFVESKEDSEDQQHSVFHPEQ